MTPEQNSQPIQPVPGTKVDQTAPGTGHPDYAKVGDAADALAGTGFLPTGVEVPGLPRKRDPQWPEVHDPFDTPTAVVDERATGDPVGSKRVPRR